MDLKELIAAGIVAFLFASLIARVKRPGIPVWAIMAFASSIAVLSGLVPIDDLDSVINLDVILFLIGMFSIVAIAESSGLLEAASTLFLSYVKSTRSAIIALSFTFGILAAVAVNDTIAVMGPPIVYFISKVLGVEPRAMYLLLAFSITVGSVATPLGNPQNMLIAIESGMDAPFIYFLRYLLVPTLINLYLTAIIVMRYYGIQNRPLSALVIPEEKIKNGRDAAIAAVTIALVIAALLVNDLLSLLDKPHVEHRGFIPFIIAAASYLFISNPREIIGKIDWSTIVFFIALFITAEGIWESGLVERTLSATMEEPQRGAEGVISITILSLTLSQFLSNVPFVKFFIEYMHHIGYTAGDVREWMVLAMASTVAGNLTLLGAASNIIILERLEKDYGKTISFIEFSRVGVAVTIVNVIVYLPFLLW